MNETETDDARKRETYRVLTVWLDVAPIVDHAESPFEYCKRLIGGGYVEIVALGDGVLLMCDEEGALPCRVCGGTGWTDGSAELRRDGRQSTECIGCAGAGSRWPHNRDVPARAPVLPPGSFVVRTDPNLARPGTVGVHRVHGPFVLARHDVVNDRPVSLTDRDVDSYLALLGGL
jgi:hypothetical protein